MKTMSTAGLRNRLEKECSKAGGQTAWARLHGVSVAYVNDVLRGRKREEVPDMIAHALGYERRVGYFLRKRNSHRK